MRVICPHVELHPTTEFCLQYQLDRRKLEVEFIKYERDDIEGYWRAINAEWECGKGFIVVEEDMAPWPGAMEEIAECHYGLCNFWSPSSWQYDHYTLGFGLGCTKFSAQLIHNHKNIMQDIANSELGKHWLHLDGQLINGLLQRGEAQHFHSPPILHLNERRYLGR